MRATHNLIRTASEFVTAAILTHKRVDAIAVFTPRSDSPPRVCHFTGTVMSCMAELITSCIGVAHDQQLADRELWYIVAGYAADNGLDFSLHIKEIGHAPAS